LYRSFGKVFFQEKRENGEQDIIVTTKKQARDARVHDGKPADDICCHKVYAIVYYGANGDRSLHIDIGVNQYQAIRACQSNTIPTCVVQIKPYFAARNFEELHKVIETQRRQMVGADAVFPSLEVPLNAVKDEFRKYTIDDLQSYSQVLQLPFCQLPHANLEYANAIELGHLRNAQRERKNTPNRKTTISERENGMKLDRIASQSKSIAKSIKELKENNYTKADYLMQKGDTIVMSGGIPHYGPMEENKVKLFFDLTTKEDNQVYTHNEQVDILVLYVSICGDGVWSNFKEGQEASGRDVLIRWLIASYVMCMCTHNTLYTKFSKMAYLFLEFKFLEGAAKKYCRDKQIELPKRAIEMFTRVENSGKYGVGGIMKDLTAFLFQKVTERGWNKFDALFTTEAVILSGPIMHVDFRNKTLYTTPNTYKYFARDVNPLQLLLECRGSPRQAIPLNQFTVVYKNSDGKTRVANTEIYQLDNADTEGTEEAILDFPRCSNEEQQLFLEEHYLAMYAIHSAVTEHTDLLDVIHESNLPPGLREQAQGGGSQQERDEGEEEEEEAREEDDVDDDVDSPPSVQGSRQSGERRRIVTHSSTANSNMRGSRRVRQRRSKRSLPPRNLERTFDGDN
jgi:hypothetical protein